ncbi:hypothetical protein LZ32DRAFT_608137 [Colletotrichum eremochloae]|nr:hypothetical protein LZ32DRAFT_608137 [Colletotrichum eremochloae]
MDWPSTTPDDDSPAAKQDVPGLPWKPVFTPSPLLSRLCFVTTPPRPRNNRARPICVFVPDPTRPRVTSAIYESFRHYRTISKTRLVRTRTSALLSALQLDAGVKIGIRHATPAFNFQSAGAHCREKRPDGNINCGTFVSGSVDFAARYL